MKPRKNDPEAAFAAAARSFEQGRFQVARTALLDLYRTYPDEPNLLRMLGGCCSELKRHDEALQYLSRVVSLSKSALDYFNLGKAFQLAGRFEEALAAHTAGLKLAPHDLRLRHAYAATLLQLGDLELAEAGFREVLTRDPKNLDAWINLAQTLVQMDRPAGSAQCLDTALQLSPALISEVGMALLRARMLTADWSDFQALVDATQRAVERNARTNPFVLLTTRDRPETHLKAARSNRSGSTSTYSAPKRDETGRIKVAYVSADFRDHPTSRLISDLLETHTRSEFEIFAISTGPDDGSSERQRIVKCTDAFIDLSRASSQHVVDTVRSLDVDIAVDLMGHTKLAMLSTFELRMAPVQINFLGYPGTTGSSEMDYVVLDPFLATDTVCKFMSEKPIVLPHCYQPNDRQRPLPAAFTDAQRTASGLPTQGFVFGALNNPGKLTPMMFAVWMRILLAVDDSVLWLLGTDPDLIRNLRDEATRCGVAPDRLIFAGFVDNAEHLARYRAIDLFLDTFPYGGHTTASDALWMGCPVLTLVGDSFASRVAGSLLSTVSLPALITNRLADYEARAIELARQPAAIASYKQHLENVRATTPLFDTERFARDLETAYRQAVKRARNHQNPKAIWVSPSRAQD